MTVLEASADPMAASMQFMERVVGDFGGLAAITLWALADEVGVLAAVADTPSTAAAAAQRCGVDARSTEEILAGLAAAGYLAREGDRFAVPAAARPILLDGSPMSSAGAAAEVSAILRMWPAVIQAVRDGQGIDPSSYPRHFHDGMERLNTPVYTEGLPSDGVTHVSGLRAKLDAGADVAEIGSGNGLALIGLATTYPNVGGVGYDLDALSVATANENAAKAGVADRVRFEERDVSGGLPDDYDVVLAFDVLHDTGDPALIATSLRKSLRADGVLLVLEPASADDPAQDVGPMAAVLRLFSVGYCLPVATHHGEARLGTTGLSPRRLEELLTGAGFSSFEQVPWAAGFNAMYAARP